jgi:hypothetical protein
MDSILIIIYVHIYMEWNENTCRKAPINQSKSEMKGRGPGSGRGDGVAQK